MFNFGPGNPDPGVFPSRELAEAAQRVILREGAELAHYPDPLGLPALRQIAAERFERNHGLKPPLEDIVITNGAMQGLQLCALGLARPGDAVVLEEFEYSGTSQRSSTRPPAIKTRPARRCPWTAASACWRLRASTGCPSSRTTHTAT